MNPPCTHVHTVPEIETPLRIDSFLCDYLGIMSRSQLARRQARFFIGDREVKASRKVRPGDVVSMSCMDVPETELIPEAMDLDIIFEDQRILAVNKRAGVVVHPGAGNFEGTLIHGVLHHCNELISRFPQDTLRPGIVHRLDKDTSGVIIFAKDVGAHEHLARQFHDRKTAKTYIAVVRGVMTHQKGSVIDRIVRDPRNRKRFMSVEDESGRGRRAETTYRVLRQLHEAALVQLRPVTGRTHQLRVHMKSLGNPIIFDPIYGTKGEQHLLLHAFSIQFTHPDGNKMLLRAPLPDRFKQYIRCCGGAGPSGVQG